jgi:hypothetical protein
MFNNNLNYVSTNGRPITSTQWTNEFKFSFESLTNRFNSLSINSSGLLSYSQISTFYKN